MQVKPAVKARERMLSYPRADTCNKCVGSKKRRGFVVGPVNGRCPDLFDPGL